MGVAERREREKQARKASILDAAETVFFTHGIDKATMDDVASTAELSKGLLYVYFRSKHDLAHAVAHRGLRLLEARFQKVLRKIERGVDQVRAMGEVYVQFSREHQDYFNLISWVQSQPADEWAPGSFGEACAIEGDKCIELTARAVSNGIADGTVRADIKPLETAVSLWAQTHGLINISNLKEVEGRFNIDPEQLYRSAFDLIMFGFSAVPRRDAVID